MSSDTSSYPVRIYYGLFRYYSGISSVTAGATLCVNNAKIQIKLEIPFSRKH
jgi:hypothetical protein